jgi:hypothetical protein
VTWLEDAGAVVVQSAAVPVLVGVFTLGTLLVLVWAAGVRHGRLLQGRDFVREARDEAVAERVRALVPGQREPN